MNGDNLTEASNTEMVKNAKEAPGGTRAMGNSELVCH